MRLNERSLIQLGQGKYQQRIRATMTSQTSALAVDIASDKKMTNQLLAAAGFSPSRGAGGSRRGRRRGVGRSGSGTRSSRSRWTATTGAAWA